MKKQEGMGCDESNICLLLVTVSHVVDLTLAEMQPESNSCSKIICRKARSQTFLFKIKQESNLKTCQEKSQTLTLLQYLQKQRLL